MAVEYDISSDVAVIKETGSVSQCARVTQMYSGQITYDDEAGSKFATATINGKSQRVMLCIAVNGTVNYDDVPSLYSTVDGHRCLNIVTPTETGTPDDVPSLYETVVIDGQNVRAVRCIMINKTPVYDGVSSTCTFTGDDGKTHTAQLVNKITGGSVVVIIKGTSPLVLPDAIANSLSYVKAFGGTEQRDIPDNYLQRQFIYMMDGSYLLTDIVPTYDGKVEMDFQTTSTVSQAVTYLGARTGSGYQSLRLAHVSNKVFRVYGFGSTADSTDVVADNTRYKFVWNNQRATLTSGNTTVLDKTFTDTGTITDYLAINGWNTDGTVSGNIEGIYLYSFKAWNAQGELVADYVPAVQKGTVPVVGFYDTVSGTFKTATAGTFAAGPEAVPTTNAPINIVSNNGVLKARHQSGLPLGYQLLSSLTSDGRCLVDTGIVLQEGDEIDLDYSLANPQPSSLPSDRFLFGTANPDVSKGGTWAEVYSSSGDISSGAWYVRFSSSASVNGNLPATTLSGHLTLKQEQLIINDATLLTPGYIGTFQTTSLTFFGRYDATLPGYKGAKMTVSHFTVKNGNAYRFNGVMVKRLSDNALGVYDLVSDTFCENIGDGTFTAGTAVSDPVEIYTDGTVETIRVSGTIPAPGASATVSTDGSSWVDLAVDVATFVAKAEPTGDLTMNFEVTYVDAPDDLSSVQPNWAGGTATLNASTALAKLAESFPKCAFELSQAVFTKTADGWDLDGNLMYYDGSETYTPIDTIHISDLSEYGITLGGTAPATDDTMDGMFFCYFPGVESGGSEVLLEEYGVTWAWDSVPTVGDIVTVTYVDGNTATAEMLLKVGDYQDVQSIIDGVITRNVGVKVLDGTENWEYRTNVTWQGTTYARLSARQVISNKAAMTTGANKFLCSHGNGYAVQGYTDGTPVGFSLFITSLEEVIYATFPQGTTANDLKQWLADQYAAGTPVIVVYPLATPTTESITGQTLQVTDGDNVLEITQASLSGLELEAEYQAAVSLTIQEVQDANLDPNVEVTIN